jgi:arsenate reductase (glutaredoxin)
LEASVSRKHTITIYHNPRCGKSRAALEILAKHGVELSVVEYLKKPPTKEELRAILKKLGMTAGQLVRKGEDIYRENFSSKAMSDEQLLDALVQYPILIERPIVIKGDRALLGRPPENVLDLL